MQFPPAPPHPPLHAPHGLPPDPLGGVPRGGFAGPSGAAPPPSRPTRRGVPAPWTSAEEEGFFEGLKAWTAARRAAAASAPAGGGAGGFAAREPTSVTTLAETVARHVRTKDAGQVRFFYYRMLKRVNAMLPPARRVGRDSTPAVARLLTQFWKTFKEAGLAEGGGTTGAAARKAAARTALCRGMAAAALTDGSAGGGGKENAGGGGGGGLPEGLCLPPPLPPTTTTPPCSSLAGTEPGAAASEPGALGRAAATAVPPIAATPSSSKLRLQLLPADEASEAAVSAAGCAPYQELRLRPHKDLASVLGHLYSKWARVAGVAGGGNAARSLVLALPAAAAGRDARDGLATPAPPPTATSLRVVDYGQAVGALHAALGRPHPFRLVYAWVALGGRGGGAEVAAPAVVPPPPPAPAPAPAAPPPPPPPPLPRPTLQETAAAAAGAALANILQPTDTFMEFLGGGNGGGGEGGAPGAGPSGGTPTSTRRPRSPCAGPDPSAQGVSQPPRRPRQASAPVGPTSFRGLFPAGTAGPGARAPPPPPAATAPPGLPDPGAPPPPSTAAAAPLPLPGDQTMDALAALAAADGGLGSLLGAPGDSWLEAPAGGGAQAAAAAQQPQQQPQAVPDRAFSALFPG